MVKVRMNTADVAAEVKCLRRLIGMRCSNVYDLSPKTYVFKLMNSSGITESGESEKVLLLMESGVRLHTTAYLRDKSNTPSGFTLKLRKHIRTRRLEDVRQLGYDRIVLFQFGVGANAYYIILELYAQGNIILTDSEYMVLTLLRSHRDDDKGFAIMARHPYPIENCRVFERTDGAKLESTLTSFNNHQIEEHVEDGLGVNETPGAPQAKKGNRKAVKSGDASKKKDNTHGKQATLKVVLGEALGYGPALSEHIILDAGLTPNLKGSKDVKLEDSSIQALTEGVKRFEDWLEDVISGAKIPEGYILMQEKKIGKDHIPVESSGTDQIYDEFCPLLLNQFRLRVSVKFETFDAALDEFYSKIESQRAEQQQQAKESSAMQKLSKIRNDQENRVQILKKEVDRAVTMAELIEYNLEDVDAAILAVRVALANGMNWDDLTRMVKEEKKSGNPVAGLIDKLHLERNSMSLLLSNNLDEMDDDEITQPVEKVEVDLSLSAHANARRWYEQKKKQESKQEKTLTAHAKAFKAAEKKTRQQLSQEKSVAAISHIRKVHWFEKFNWFISSENYLVISGRDAQQNEMIVKRYMSKGDLYVHAELHGASSTVIKNHKPDSPVPPLTLNQAGSFTVCHSQAWNSKIVTSAWWVYPHQVSKTAPTGEYLTVGSFMIRGKKNFLPPHPLIMGFGILFRLDETSLGSHLNERRVRGEDEGLNETEDTEPFKELSDTGSENEAPDAENLVHVSDLSTDNQKLGNVSSEVDCNRDLSTDNQKLGNVSSEVDCNREVSSDSAQVSVEEKTSAATASPELEDLLDRALELGSAAKKYGLVPASQTESDINNNGNEEKKETVSREKPYISKAERRKLKKGQTHSEGGNGGHVEKKKFSEGGDGGHAEKKKNKAEQKNVENIMVDGGGKVSRGQKGKLKKMKEKYGDQDEEERKIRMALLASAGRAKSNEQEAQSEAITTSKELKPVGGGNEDAIKRCYKCKKVGHLAKDCQEDANGVAQLNEAERMAMEEDDIKEIGEDEKEKLNDVDYLTGVPLPNDILLYAVPVCAPYAAVQSYKYRVKIIPGTAKKGKAAKMAMNLFGHMPEASQREKELMKACTDPELMAAIIGNVKISAAGLTQLKQKQKKGKKAASKQS
ncbi:putative transcription factor interactor and regulator CCHC(Zn) family [Helianthus annuus]|nr:putative transcription factor interactor and regulator CCHC(Zn) family [Helianthus annuus]